MLKAVLFDVMGVIFPVGDDVEGLLIPFINSKKPGISPELIRKTYREASLGKMTSEAFWETLGFEGDIRFLEEKYLSESFMPDKAFIPCVKALGKRCKIALLSNDIAEWSRYLRNRHKIDEVIDFAFISGELGMRKPDPKIYGIALSTLEVRPEECVFIDDYPERVEAASRLGIRGMLFNREGWDYVGEKVESFKRLTEVLL